MIWVEIEYLTMYSKLLKNAYLFLK
jgi:hypothetical protein